MTVPSPTQTPNAPTRRSLSGLDAAAWALSRVFDRVAVVAGDGAQRLAEAVRTAGGGALLLDGTGADAATVAFGHACAGERVALLLSGREGVYAAMAVLREASRLDVALVAVVAGHGDESGRAVASGPCDDIAALLREPVGLVVAGAPGECCALTLAASVLARASSMPWCVAFELARVGCALAPVSLPAEASLAAWRAVPVGDITVDRYARVDDAWRAVERCGGDARRVVARGGGASWELRAGEVSLPSAGSSVALRQWRPFPARALTAALAGASELRVVEALPDGWGGGALSADVCGLVADARVVTTDDDPDTRATQRIDLAWNEPARGELVRAMVEALDDAGHAVEANLDAPWYATVRSQIAGNVRQKTIVRGVLCEPGALGLASVLRAMLPGRVVVAGTLRGEVLVSTRAMCEARGCTLAYVAEADVSASEIRRRGAWVLPGEGSLWYRGEAFVSDAPADPDEP